MKSLIFRAASHSDRVYPGELDQEKDKASQIQQFDTQALVGCKRSARTGAFRNVIVIDNGSEPLRSVSGRLNNTRNDVSTVFAISADSQLRKGQFKCCTPTG